jgi:hypothetical protein
MSGFLKSDLVRSLMGGFAMGAIALVALTPAEGTETLRAKIEAIYKA